MVEQFPHDRAHPQGLQYVPGTENYGLEHDAANAHNPAALSPDHQSDNTGDGIPVDGHPPNQQMDNMDPSQGIK